MELEVESRDDAEVAAAAADAPEELAVLALTRRDDRAVRRHHLGLDEVVAGEAVLRRRPPVPAARREAADPGRRHPPARRVQAVLLRGAVELPPKDAAAHAGDAGSGIDVDLVEAEEVDHDPVADAEPGHAVAA